MRWPLAPRFAGDAFADVVIEADHRRLARGLASEDALFRGDITFHAAVAVEMIGRDVEQDRDVENEALGQFELIGAHLEHVDAIGAERLERQRRYAEIAADRNMCIPASARM